MIEDRELWTENRRQMSAEPPGKNNGRSHKHKKETFGPPGNILKRWWDRFVTAIKIDGIPLFDVGRWTFDVYWFLLSIKRAVVWAGGWADTWADT